MAQEVNRIVYSSESNHSFSIKKVAHFMSDLQKAKSLAYRLTVRDIKARYRQTLFGFLVLWITPIVTTVTFVCLNKAKIIQMPEVHMPYYAFVLLGTVIWQLFTESLQAPLRATSSNRSILTKINFPYSSLVLCGVMTVLFDFMIKFSIVLVVFFVLGCPLSLGVFSSLFLLFVIVMLGTAIGLFLTPFHLLYADISTMVSHLCQFFFLLTPVVYPTPEHPFFQWVHRVNPMSPLLVSARELIVFGTVEHGAALIGVSVLALVSLIIGWIWYQMAIPILIERMGA